MAAPPSVQLYCTPQPHNRSVPPIPSHVRSHLQVLPTCTCLAAPDMQLASSVNVQHRLALASLSGRHCCSALLPPTRGLCHASGRAHASLQMSTDAQLSCVSALLERRRPRYSAHGHACGRSTPNVYLVFPIRQVQCQVCTYTRRLYCQRARFSGRFS